MPDSLRASVYDWQWRGTVTMGFPYWFAMGSLWMAVAAMVKRAADATAPTAASTRQTMPDAYGFHVRGNFSFWSPGVMNRTDWNVSSGTYGLWIPPPGARSQVPAPHRYIADRPDPPAIGQSGVTTASKPPARPSVHARTSCTRSSLHS
jgi:hypothetical protein